jgi:entry exclusion lipoprotein TrbK
MYSLRGALVAILFSISMLSGGCTDTQANQLRECDDIDKVVDPQKKRELATKCFRAGEFKPSRVVTW